jgi:hypothetical protein
MEDDRHLMWVTGHVHAIAGREAEYPAEAGSRTAYRNGYQAALRKKKQRGDGILGITETGTIATYAAGVVPPGGIAGTIVISDPRVQAARDATGFVPRQDVTLPMSVLLTAYYDLRRATLGLLDVIDGDSIQPGEASGARSDPARESPLGQWIADRRREQAGRAQATGQTQA